MLKTQRPKERRVKSMRFLYNLIKNSSIGKRIVEDSRSLDPAFDPHIYTPEIAASEHFFFHTRNERPQVVLEVGTLQAVVGRSTVHRNALGDFTPKEYICLDIEHGPDVDIVGDLHNLPAEWTNRFDALIAVAVFEHLERPWIAAKEVARVLAPGGRFFVSTHQCFPIHGYPSDYFRFSKEALRLIFEDVGLSVEVCEYQHRSAIIMPETLLPKSERKNWNNIFPSFVLVEASGRKL